MGLLLFGVSAQAQLLHTYSFDGAAPLADGVGSAALLNAGAVSFGEDEGLSYASFNGSSTAHLVVDESTAPFSLGGYTISFWFRFETLAQVNWSGLFSSGDTSQSGYQIDTHSGVLRFMTGVSSQTLNLSPTVDLGVENWHLLTITPTGVWINGTSLAYSSNYSLNALRNFALGANRSRNSGFKGDIADVRIYGPETQWDAAMQASAYADGPGLPAAPNPGTVILISRSKTVHLDPAIGDSWMGAASGQRSAVQQ